MTHTERESALTDARNTHDMCLNRAHNDNDKSVQANMLRFAALARKTIITLKGVSVVG